MRRHSDSWPRHKGRAGLPGEAASTSAGARGVALFSSAGSCRSSNWSCSRILRLNAPAMASGSSGGRRNSIMVNRFYQFGYAVSGQAGDSITAGIIMLEYQRDLVDLAPRQDDGQDLGQPRAPTLS